MSTVVIALPSLQFRYYVMSKLELGNNLVKNYLRYSMVRFVTLPRVALTLCGTALFKVKSVFYFLFREIFVGCSTGIPRC
jgi:hypothetical protein